MYKKTDLIKLVNNCYPFNENVNIKNLKCYLEFKTLDFFALLDSAEFEKYKYKLSTFFTNIKDLQESMEAKKGNSYFELYLNNGIDNKIISDLVVLSEKYESFKIIFIWYLVALAEILEFYINDEEFTYHSHNNISSFFKRIKALNLSSYVFNTLDENFHSRFLIWD